MRIGNTVAHLARVSESAPGSRESTAARSKRGGADEGRAGTADGERRESAFLGRAYESPGDRSAGGAGASAATIPRSGDGGVARSQFSAGLGRPAADVAVKIEAACGISFS